MAEKKTTEWDDVGQEYDPEQERAAQQRVVPGQTAPYKGWGTKAYERFWGSDVDEDPMEFIRLGSQLVGGVGGAMAGGAAGAVVGGPVGAGIGAAIGGFAGGARMGTAVPEMGLDAAEFLGVANEGTRDKLGLTDQELDTVLEGEAILDMITGGGLIAARGAVRGVTRSFVGMSRKGKDTAEFAAEHGVNMLPVQVGKREVPRGFVAVMGKFPLVAGPLKRSIGKREQEIKAAFENLPADIAPIATLNEISHEVFMAAKNQVTKISTEFDSKYKDIYRQADHAGTTVLPTETASRVTSVIAEIAKETPNAARQGRTARKATPTALMDDVKGFLTNDIAVMFKKHRSGDVTVAPQTFEQMGTVLEKIDEKIASLAKKDGVLAEQAVSRLQQVRQAAQIDMYTNAQGKFGQDVAQDLRALDTKYTETVSDLFNTTAAKRFGAVRKGGLSHLEMGKQSTRVSMDNLTDILMKGENLSELDEIANLVEPHTFKKMAAYSISKKVEGAYGDGGKTLDVQVLAKSLGLDNPKGGRYLHTKKLLEKSNSPWSMEDLGKLVEIGEMVGKVEAPNASTFIARRGVMAGAEGIIKGLAPFAALAGSHQAGKAVAGEGGGMLAAMMFIGGSHMVGRMIADPRIARPVHKVLDQETRSVVRKGAALQVGRIFSNTMVEDGEFDMKEALNWRKHFEGVINGVDKMFKQQKFQQEHRVPTSE